MKAAWLQTLRSLTIKSCETLLFPRVAAQVGRTETLLQVKSPVLPEVRQAIAGIWPEKEGFEVVVEVGLAGGSGIVTVERWQFSYWPRPDPGPEVGETLFYKPAAMALRAIIACAVLLPAVLVFPKRLIYRISLRSGDGQPWSPTLPIKTIRARPVLTSPFGEFRVKVDFRDPLPCPGELFPVSTMSMTGAGESPRARPRLQSSGNIVALTAKCTAAGEAGYIPLSTSFTEDQDMYLSGSESEGEMELVVEGEGEVTSAVFRRTCKDVQALKLFSGRELPSMRVFLEEMKRTFASVQKTKEALVKAIDSPKVV